MRSLFFFSLVCLTMFVLLPAGAQEAPTPSDPAFYDGKNNGEIILGLIDFWDQFYQERFLDRGIDPSEAKGSGYHPYNRWKYYVGQRIDENGHLPMLGRWQAYKQSKQTFQNNTGPVPTAQWQNLGPTNRSGRILSYAFDPTDSEIIWIGSADGGLWRTTDAAESWEPMTDHIPSMAVGAVAINPLNRDRMLIGTGEGFGSILMVNGVGVLSSNDRGLSWGETSFSYMQSQFVSCFNLVWDAADTNNVYLAATNGIWVSRNGGADWSLKRSGRCTALVLNRQSPDTLFAAFQSDGIYLSADAGETWSKHSNGLPPAGSEFGFTSLAICDSFPNVLYAGISNGNFAGQFGALKGFYKSRDSGASWQLLDTPNFYCYPTFPDICQGWYDNVTAVAPYDSNTIFSGGIHLYRSRDGGKNWPIVGGEWPNLVVHVDHHNFAFDPERLGTVYSFNDGGVYKSTDNGNSWEEKNNGLITMQFYSIASALTDTAIVSGGSQDNGTWAVDNSGGNTDWFNWFGGDGMVTNIDPTNAQVMYGTWQFGQHFKSLNGGQSAFTIMSGILEDGPWVTPVVIDPFDTETLYTASNSRIYKTTTGGIPWEVSANIGNIGHLAIDPTDSEIVYAATSTFQGGVSTIYRTTNGGTDWLFVSNTGRTISDIECDPEISGTVYITNPTYNTGQQVWRSDDYGASWQNISGNFPQIPANAITINPSNTSHLYVATDLGVYASTDGGGEWFEYNNNLPNVYVWDMHFHPEDYTIRAGTYGRGYWKAAAIDSTIGTVALDAPVSEQAPATFTLHPAFPNPFNPSTTIRYSLPVGSEVTVAIYNELGQQLRELFNGHQPAGTHDLSWDARNQYGSRVASGTYFVRVSVDGMVRIQKIQYLK